MTGLLQNDSRSSVSEQIQQKMIRVQMQQRDFFDWIAQKLDIINSFCNSPVPENK